MKIYFFGLLFLSNFYCQAQTLEEWTSQGTTQIKYLLEQIAAQKVYLERLSNAYRTIHKGADIIGDIKGKRISIHSLYFNSLSLINPGIADRDFLTAIFLKQKAAIKNLKYTQDLMKNTSFSAGLRNYILQASNRAISGVNKTADALIEIFEPSQLNMTDEERMKRLNASACEVNAVLLFSTAILQQVKALLDENKQRPKQLSHFLQLSGIEN